MKTLYIDCSMGAAGDMLMAALLELIDDKDAFLSKLNSIMPDGIFVSAHRELKCGIAGTHMSVKIHGKEEAPNHHDHDHSHHTHHEHNNEHHQHSGIYDIEAVIDSMDVSDNVKIDAKNIYKIIAEAESEVHGEKLENIHFHEVGTLDAVCDVVGNCMLMEKIGAKKIVASPIHVGAGTVRCAHGVLPVPAPATALILRGIPAYGGEIQGEMCTPTGAALLRYFVDEFGPMPSMISKKIGYGLGTKDFAERANCLRITLGDSTSYEAQVDYVCELAVNLDDMTGEDIGFAVETLMDNGALDVYLEHIIMKKSRPAVKLVCICKEAEKDKFVRLVLKHTTSIGVRQYECKRFVMDREILQEDTEYGSVRFKHSKGYDAEKSKAEYDDVAELAKKMNQPLADIRMRIKG